MYRNEGDLQFKKVSENWGLDVPLNSNGAAYADLDNDGDLDLVMNNVDDVASIFENKLEGSSCNYIRLKIDGYAQNKQAIGAKVYPTKCHTIRFGQVPHHSILAKCHSIGAGSGMGARTCELPYEPRGTRLMFRPNE